jgi:hypothetical protein
LAYFSEDLLFGCLCLFDEVCTMLC